MPSGFNAIKDPQLLIEKANAGIPLDRVEIVTLVNASGVKISKSRVRQLELRAIGKIVELLDEFEGEVRGPVARKRRRCQRVG